jgi:hypothetical protein
MAPNKPTPAPVIEDPSLRTIFADTFIVAADHGGAISITLGDRRYLPGSQPTNGAARVGAQTVHVAARIALTPRAAAEMVRQLGAILAKINAPKPAATAPDAPLVAKH